MVAAEYGYKEVDRQLKEQFIHGVNDKIMLDEIIRELMSRTSNVQMTSEDVLAWAKRVKAQRAQAAVLNDLTEIKVFDKIKKGTESKSTQGREVQVATHQRGPCRYCGQSHAPRQCPVYRKMCAAFGKTGHFRNVCRSKRSHAVHEVEIDMEAESQEEDTEIVSINSVYVNKKQLSIMAKLQMQVGKNVIRSCI